MERLQRRQELRDERNDPMSESAVAERQRILGSSNPEALATRERVEFLRGEQARVNASLQQQQPTPGAPSASAALTAPTELTLQGRASRAPQAPAPLLTPEPVQLNLGAGGSLLGQTSTLMADTSGQMASSLERSVQRLNRALADVRPNNSSYGGYRPSSSMTSPSLPGSGRFSSVNTQTIIPANRPTLGSAILPNGAFSWGAGLV